MLVTGSIVSLMVLVVVVAVVGLGFTIVHADADTGISLVAKPLRMWIMALAVNDWQLVPCMLLSGWRSADFGCRVHLG